MIFVFGSNEAGIHGAGAARYALTYEGAVWKKGIGHHGNSYAIPTKDMRIHTLDLPKIQRYVEDFIQYASARTDLQFKVTQIGCGLAGYTPEQIAPLFMDAPTNCYFDRGWQPTFMVLGVNHNYWN